MNEISAQTDNLHFLGHISPGGFFRSGGGGVAAAIQFCVFGLVCNGSEDIWGWLWFSCGIARLISVFQEFSASIDKAFILAGGVATGLSFFGV